MKEFRLSFETLGELITLLTESLKSGKVFRVSITEWRERRSLDQNSLYWKWLKEIAEQKPLYSGDYTGAELWHEVFKKYYCPEKVISSDKAQMKVKSTKLLDVGEMHFYLNKIESFCLNGHVKLTIPDNCQYSELKHDHI